MIIKLKLKQEVLVLLSNVLQTVYQENVIGKDVNTKLATSIGYGLADKFQKKVKNQLKKANLFDTNKLIDVSVSYHEAWAMKWILNDNILNQSCHKNEFRLQVVIDKLDQKLI